MGLTMVAGSPLSRYENDTRRHVAHIDTNTAAALGISSARLANHPPRFVGGIAYTVVGIYSSAQRVVTDESAMLIPENTALADFGNPQPGIENQNEAQMVVATRIGAAQAVARQIAAAELPTDPSRLVVTSPAQPAEPAERGERRPGRPVPDPRADQPADRRGRHREHDPGGGARAHRGDRPAPRRRGQAPAHRGAVPGRVHGARHARRADRHLHRGRGRRDLRRDQELDRGAEPGVHAARAAIGSVVGLLAGAYPALRAARTSPLAALRHA